MLHRWDTRVSDINNFVECLEDLCPEIKQIKKKRGKPPERPIKEYVALILLKEERHNTLREAETEWSYKVCDERVDHSVIHYWEKKHEVQEVLTALIRRIALILITLLTPLFDIIDSTKFATWRNKEIEFHTQTLVTKETVFPINVYFGSVSPSKAVTNTLIPNTPTLMADAWYDDNKALGIMLNKKFKPIVKPNTGRYSGYYRRIARKIFNIEWPFYKQRSRGESPYGTLTNTYGDRLKTILTTTTQTRILTRICNYLIKLYIRAKTTLTILRHVPIKFYKT